MQRTHAHRIVVDAWIGANVEGHQKRDVDAAARLHPKHGRFEQKGAFLAHGVALLYERKRGGVAHHPRPIRTRKNHTSHAGSNGTRGMKATVAQMRAKSPVTRRASTGTCRIHVRKTKRLESAGVSTEDTRIVRRRGKFRRGECDDKLVCDGSAQVVQDAPPCVCGV